MFNKKIFIMCIYTAIHKNTEISFLPENIFQENGQVIVKNPRNSDDFNDKQVPEKIKLSDLRMKEEEKNKILAMFAKKKDAKTKAKTRKDRANMRQI
jgi:ureidoglycolate hydrolase